MKKLIPQMIVEDYCDKCCFFCWDDVAGAYCNNDNGQGQLKYVSPCNLNGNMFPIPDWCPLETVE